MSLKEEVGSGGLVLDNVATLPLLTLSRVWCGLVKPGDFLSLMSKYFAPFSHRQFHESTAIFEGECRGFLQLVFLRNHHPEFTTLGIRDQSISRTVLASAFPIYSIR